jgi:hypothetical protein
MTIYMHIGTECTGTTSLQQFFFTNRDLLQSRGIYYPAIDDVNHISLAIYAAEHLSNVEDLIKYKPDYQNLPREIFRKEIENRLKNEISKASVNCHTIVLSNEHCCARLFKPEAITRLKGLLDQISGDIKIVLYLRRQDEFLYSSYSTYVKSGGTVPFYEKCNKLLPARYNYHEITRKWSNIFGKENMIIRTFEKARLQKGSIIDDFLDAIDAEASGDYTIPENQNFSLDGNTLEFLRLLNIHIPVFHDNKVNTEREKILEYLERISEKNPKLKYSAYLRQFFESFKNSNRMVVRDFFDREELFAESARDLTQTEAANHDHFDLDMAFDIFSKLWIQRNSQ